MKAIVYKQYGGPEVLEYVDVPEPKISQNSVLVRVKAAAMNPADHILQSGAADRFTDAWFPVIPGWDVAGVVERVGAGVTEFAPGDAVFGYIRNEILRHGSYAEFVSVPVETLVRKPDAMSWHAAAGLPLAGLTAFRAVIQVLAIERGETLLIHGAAGGVGALAAQLAVSRGARVIGSASIVGQDFLASIGVEPVVYGEGLSEKIRAIFSHEFDAVFDCAGNRALESSVALIGPATRVCSIAAGGPGITTVFARQSVEILSLLADQVVSGHLKVPIAAVWPLAAAAAAQEALKKPHAPGKFILVPDAAA
ncbi:hypothetical protein A6V36_13850 [Paraburkholderia ginsengiterrae]|uniref:Enoyl reductase (ER) domain-containing protein n=1 Tax=Paraburkholderia ginsengiterrae TaxID=1462993 RepID=A0A1A9MZ30_9BURK|nr:NADP-dependent oxidoreductase [Paraburkholderia ginsengiterrae]OAJ52489.1 hypothetical protein A6V36_13850 [Paraburkholderia ginsengiterrae]OAJ52635.1 hypothetical protein A6V37_09350 [Paraburkholderia ginsengiterrae]